jgi:ATP-dependent Clp protease adaptor protein ClpS
MSQITLGMITLSTIAAPERTQQTTRKPYPNFKVVVLNDDFNTFEHVIDCLLQHIPHMNLEKAEQLTSEIHHSGAATVWVGPQEQAELYHMQLGIEGLTMGPLESA